MRGTMALFFTVAAATLIAPVSCGGDRDCGGDLFACGGGGGDGGAGASSATGGSGASAGGAGGSAPCVVEDCPPGNGCQAAACIAGLCGFTNLQDGTPCGADAMLQCQNGVCAGCTVAEDCAPVDCFTRACTAGECVYELAAEQGCGPEGIGQCSAQGVCALCDDGKKNGDETGTDCGGHCGATCTTGQTCASKADCESDSQECIDGVCCAADCSGPCLSCAEPGKEGLCTLVAGPDPGQCGGSQACSPAGACLAAAGQPCSEDSQCATGHCPAGTCAGCSAGSPCAADEACVDASCVPAAQPQGAPCAGPAACASGFCVDGVCCDAACDGPCEACATAYTQNVEGHCYFIILGYDPQDECAGPGPAGVCNGNGQCGQN